MNRARPLELDRAWRRNHAAPSCRIRDLEHFMLDLIMLAIGFVFFAVSIAYVYACDQL